jgi:hypothetical protein
VNACTNKDVYRLALIDLSPTTRLTILLDVSVVPVALFLQSVKWLSHRLLLLDDCSGQLRVLSWWKRLRMKWFAFIKYFDELIELIVHAPDQAPPLNIEIIEGATAREVHHMSNHFFDPQQIARSNYLWQRRKTQVNIILSILLLTGLIWTFLYF